MAKAKSSKNFYALRVRFCGIVESSVESCANRVDSAIAYNQSNCGGGFVFVENFGIELD